MEKRTIIKESPEEAAERKALEDPKNFADAKLAEAKANFDKYAALRESELQAREEAVAAREAAVAARENALPRVAQAEAQPGKAGDS